MIPYKFILKAIFTSRPSALYCKLTR